MAVPKQTECLSIPGLAVLQPHLNSCTGIVCTYFAMTKVGTYKAEAYAAALAFRRRGFTYTEIARICNVSRGTVSNWLRHEEFSQPITLANKKRAALDNKKRIALVNKARVVERKTQYASALKAAETEYRHYRSAPLFIAGLTLYLSRMDGGTGGKIRFSTGAVDQQVLFIRFLQAYLGVERSQIHLWLLLYPAHDEVQALKYWSRKTGVSVAQFHKSQVIQGRSSRETLQFGVLNTIIGSTLLQKKLAHWVGLLKKELKTT